MVKEKLNTRAAGVVALAVMLSRVLGLARELIFAALFGAGRGMDAYITAYRAPNLLRDLFAEGALSIAFVTVFSKLGVEKSYEASWELARKMATLALVFMSGVTLLGMIFAPLLIGVLAPGFDAGKAAFATELTRIMFPFILLVSLAALVMGMLSSRNIFRVPALASSFYNLGSIFGGESRLVDRSDLRFAGPDRHGHRHADRRFFATGRADPEPQEGRVHLPLRLRLARRAGEARVVADATGGHCGQRGADQCDGQ